MGQDTRDCDDIDSVTVEADTVTVRGRDPQTRISAATAVRYPGRLVGALE